MRKQGVTWCLHYIDDFLTAGRPETEECAKNLQTTIRTCEWLGLPLKSHKIEGPTPVIPFLGIVLDTEKGEIRLPEEKMKELTTLIKEWLNRKHCKKRALLSLIGKLAHACKVVQVGRIFLRRMIEVATKTTQFDHWIHLNSEFRADLHWWDSFMSIWNGKSMFEVHNPKWQPQVTFSSDASGSWGCGAVWQHKWIQFQWNKEWAAYHIAIKELLPITIACAVWGHYWQHQHVLVLCDNMSVVQILTKFKSRDPVLMHLLRCLHFFCAIHDVKLRSEHIAGVHNVVADAVSRNNLSILFAQVPRAEKLPTLIPHELFQFLINNQPNWQSPIWRDWLKNSSMTAWRTALSGHTYPHRSSTNYSANV